MKSCSALIITLLLLIFCFSPGQALSQCPQRLGAKGIKVNKDAQAGSFNLSVIAPGSYKGQLLQINGTVELVVNSFNGTGNKNFSFKELELSQEEIYRVVVEFDGEEVFLCKRKVLDIDFTNR